MREESVLAEYHREFTIIDRRDHYIRIDHCARVAQFL
jgi:hypothetical protein